MKRIPILTFTTIFVCMLAVLFSSTTTDAAKKKKKKTVTTKITCTTWDDKEIMMGKTINFPKISTNVKKSIKSIKYSSNNKKVATVDKNGKITVCYVGGAKISAKVKYYKNSNAVSKKKGTKTKTFSCCLEGTIEESDPKAANSIYYGQSLKNVVITGGVFVADDIVYRGGFEWEDATIIPAYSQEPNEYAAIRRANGIRVGNGADIPVTVLPTTPKVEVKTTDVLPPKNKKVIYETLNAKDLIINKGYAINPFNGKTVHGTFKITSDFELKEGENTITYIFQPKEEEDSGEEESEGAYNSVSGSVKVYAQKRVDISSVYAECTDSYYIGKEIMPEYKIYDSIKKEEVLIKAKDYKIIENKKGTNTDVDGENYFTVQGLGYYTGELKIFFKILPCDLEELEYSLEDTSFIFNGKTQIPNITPIVLNEDYTLKQDKDFTVVYTGGIHAGVSLVDIIGTKNFTGRVSLSYNIDPYDLSTGNSNVTFAQKIYNVTQTTNPVEPNPIVTALDYTLTKGTDFTCSYEDNYGSTESDTTAVCTVKGKGDYTGEITGCFSIPKISIAKKITTGKNYKVKTLAKQGIFSLKTTKKANTYALTWKKFGKKGSYNIYKKVGKKYKKVKTTKKKTYTFKNTKSKKLNFKIARGKTIRRFELSFS